MIGGLLYLIVAVVNLYAQWNKAPSLITTNKVFYENEISEQTWLNDYRMKNIRAVDLRISHLIGHFIIARCMRIDIVSYDSYLVAQITVFKVVGARMQL